MQLERYFYSDSQNRQKQFPSKYSPHESRLDISYSSIQETLTPEEEQIVQTNIHQMLTAASSYPADPQDPYKVILPQKILDFQESIDSSVKLAKALCANLEIYTENWTGAILFVCNELNYTKMKRIALMDLIERADEVHIKRSANAGANSPVDVDGAIEIDFWFDFYKYLYLVPEK